MIRITRTNDEIVAISFNGEELHSDGRERWYLPKSLIGDEIVNHLPADIIFEICHHPENQAIGIETIPIYIQKISNNIVLVSFEESNHRDGWVGELDLNCYMETKKKVIQHRAEEVGDISLNQYKDDGTWIHLFFSTKIMATTINLVLIQAEQMMTEIENAVETHFEKEI